MELWSMGAAATAALVRGREVSAREVAEAAIARMEAVNGPINAVVDPLPEAALAEADAVDAAVARGIDPGPLAGVPVTVKVNVDAEGRATTNGLRVQKENVAAEDNPVVANLRRAGAIVIGRTNTPAFSLRWFTRNSLHGHTLNPHDRAITPGGSSGGAGSAVAAGIGAVAHGTDIAGSVRYPAYACGVHGLRPTPGRVPAANLSGPDRSMGAQITAVSGPLARSIEDVGLALLAMAQQDARDPWWVPAALQGPSLPRRAALCVNPDGLETRPEVEAALRAAAAALEDAGWEVEEAHAPGFRRAAAINMALWMAETRGGLGEKIVAEDDPDANAVFAALAEYGDAAGDPWAALTERLGLMRAWSEFMAEFPVVLCPVSAEAPFADQCDVDGSRPFAEVYEAQLTQVGLPALGFPGLSVSTGVPGRPMGVQLIAERFREDVLLEAGAAIAAGLPPIRPVDPFVTGG